MNIAKLRIYPTGVTPAGDSPVNFKGVYLTSAWSEKTVTWNQHQPDWGSEIGVGQASSQLGWFEADVTKMVRDWVDVTRQNFGFILVGDEGVMVRLRVYFIKDAGSSFASRLIVNYEEIPATCYVSLARTQAPASDESRVADDRKPPYHISYNGAAGTYYLMIFTKSGSNNTTPYTLWVTYPNG